MTDHLRTAEAEAGYRDHGEGKNFAQCPYDGFRPDDIQKRWCWQQGWLRADQEKLNQKPKGP